MKSDGHDHMRSGKIGLQILIGFLLFFVSEKLVSRNIHSHSHSPDHRLKTDSKSSKEKGSGRHLDPPGWLNIAADLMHNFTDGLAIGASFASGKSLALATTVSVFFHEIPHEIGDVSILIQSGFSKQDAIWAQFATAIAAFIGMQHFVPHLLRVFVPYV